MMTDNPAFSSYTVIDIEEARAFYGTPLGIEFERYDTMPVSQDDKGILHGREAGYGPDIAWFKDPAGNTLSVLHG